MKYQQIVAIVVGITIFATGHWLPGGIIIEETFTGYLDNALISTNPAGPALGLTGNWTVKSENSHFYVNRTELDPNSGTGKAVYDREGAFNGERTATRLTSAEHELFRNSGDTFYAGFLIDPALASGDMTFELGLAGIDDGGLAGILR